MGNKRAVIFGAILIALIIGLYFIIKNMIGDNWFVSLSATSKDPYGTYVAQELLDSYFPDKQFVTVDKFISRTLDTNETNANYIYIGHDLFLDQKEIKTLKRFVEKGNRVFISSFNISDSLFISLYPNNHIRHWTNYENYEDSIIRINLQYPLPSSQPIQLYVRDKYHKIKYTFPYLPERELWKSSSFRFDKLGVMQDSFCNFFGFGYGKGAIYIHTTPLVFTNYFLKNRAVLDYSSNAFSVLQNGKIYFDNRNYSGYQFNKNFEKNPIQYIISNASLSWAWFLSICSILLYIFFFAKRRQNPIKVLPHPSNSALAFIKNMGALYFNNNNHKQIAIIRLRYFFNFLKDRYGFLQKDISNENSIILLSQKSGIEIQYLKNLFRQIQVIEHAIAITEADLQNLYSEIEQFKTLAK